MTAICLLIPPSTSSINASLFAPIPAMALPLLSPTRGVKKDSIGLFKPITVQTATRHTTLQPQKPRRQSTQQFPETRASTIVSTSDIDREYLRQHARWIRDVLDPQVAQDGPDALHSDEILTLDELLRRLLISKVTLEDIRYSRMHLALLYIAGVATRWPKKLIDRCEELRVAWEAEYGSLRCLGTPLYEHGGRLHGICKPEDMNRDRLLVKWLKSPSAKLSPAVSRRSGDLGFTPGDWWISPIFAHRAGIIDMSGNEGGIVYDANTAFAIVMTGDDEIAGARPETFQYRCRDNFGRYRLTAGTPESRQPVRILRSHSLRSAWKPRAGLRYDGLHKVVGWMIKQDPKTGKLGYVVSFQRLSSEVGMDTVLKRPWTDEVEDYSEYKRIRQLQRDKHKDSMQPSLRVSIDGTMDTDEYDSPDESPEYLQTQVTLQKRLVTWSWNANDGSAREARDSLMDISPGHLSSGQRRSSIETVVWTGSESSSCG